MMPPEMSHLEYFMQWKAMPEDTAKILFLNQAAKDIADEMMKEGYLTYTDSVKDDDACDDGYAHIYTITEKGRLLRLLHAL